MDWFMWSELEPIKNVVKSSISDFCEWKKSGLKGRTQLICPTGFRGDWSPFNGGGNFV